MIPTSPLIQRLTAVSLLLCLAIFISVMTAAEPVTAAQVNPRAPSNDAFSGAALLSFPATVSVPDIELATIETSEPLHGCRSGQAGTGSYSVWYRFTLATSGTVNLSIAGSTLSPAEDSLLSVYQGETIATLTEVACNDDVEPGYYSALLTWLPAGSYWVKASYWHNNPSTPMQANSTLVLDASFVPNPDTPTPTATSTLTPTPTASATVPTATNNPTIATATSTPVILPPTSTATATKPSPEAGLIQNGDFELDLDGDKLPDGWTGVELAKDKRVCNTSQKIIAYQGACAFRFKNKGGEASELSQLISVETLAKQQTLIFSAAVEVTQPVGKAMMLKISYAEPDAGLKGNGKDKVALKLESITFGYNRLSQTFTLLGTPTKLELRLIHKKPDTRLMIDALSLQVQP